MATKCPRSYSNVILVASPLTQNSHLIITRTFTLDTHSPVMLKIAQQHLLINAHSKITEDRYMKEETR